MYPILERSRFTLFGIALLSLPCAAQTPKFHHRAGGDLRGVFFHDTSTGWTAEEGARIRYTTDGGSTWRYEDTPDKVRHILRGIFFLSDGTTGWACGDDGFVVGTTDAGTTWTLLTDSSVGGTPVLTPGGNPGELFSIYFFDANNGWVVGDKGMLQKTTDGGKNWAFPSGCTYPTVLQGPSSTSHDDDLDAYKVLFTSSTTGFVASEFGNLLKTTDSGCTWSTTALDSLISPPLSSGSNLELWSIDFKAGTGLGFVVGGVGTSQGYFFATSDTGANWYLESPCSGSANTEYGVTSVPGTRGALSVGYGSQVWVRTAGVPTQCWTMTWPSGPGHNPPLQAITAMDSTHAWWVGMFNIIRKSTDNGSTYTDQAGVDYNRIFGADFLSTSTGCVTGEFYGIHRTTDGGVHWTQVNAYASNGGADGRALAFNPAGTKAVAVGDPYSGTEFVAYSTDAGVTWNNVSTTLPYSSSYWKALSFVPSTDTVRAAGSGGRVMKSTDAGQNWTANSGTSPNNLPSGFDITGIKFYDANHGYVVGSSSGSRAAYSTSDGGTNWSSMSFSGGSSTDLLQGVDATSSTAYAVGNAGSVYKLVSGTWTAQSLGITVTADLLAVSMVPSSSEVFVGGSGGVVLHFDGSSWTSPKSQTESDLHAVSFQSTSHGFIVGRQFVTCEYN